MVTARATETDRDPNREIPLPGPTNREQVLFVNFVVSSNIPCVSTATWMSHPQSSHLTPRPPSLHFNKIFVQEEQCPRPSTRCEGHMMVLRSGSQRTHIIASEVGPDLK